MSAVETSKPKYRNKNTVKKFTTDRVHDEGRFDCGLNGSILGHQLIQRETVKCTFRFETTFDFPAISPLATRIQSVLIHQHRHLQQRQLADFLVLHRVQLFVRPTLDLHNVKSVERPSDPNSALVTSRQLFDTGGPLLTLGDIGSPSE